MNSPSRPPLPNDPLLRANRLCGLAETLIKMKQDEQARTALAQAKATLPHFFLPYFLEGVWHYERKEYEPALTELRQARQLNPFHEEICNYLSLAAFHSGQTALALEALIDAFLLSGEFKGETPSTYQQRIKILVEKMEGMDAGERTRIFKERQTLFDQLYQTTLADIGVNEVLPPPPTAAPPAEEAEPPAADASAAQRYKKISLFSAFSNAQISNLASLFSRRQLAAGQFLFKEEEPARGIYFCLAGRIVLQKNTPFGALIYREIGEGGFVGEEHFVENAEHWADAFCPEEAEVVFLSKGDLKELFLKEREMAVHFLWYFWKNIGRTLLNCRLRLLPELERLEQQVRNQKDKKTPPLNLEKDFARRLQLLEHKNLSSNEIRLLQLISRPRPFHTGERIYQRGELGKTMYVVAGGSVALSYEEEVHSILEQGDFFGELSLISEIGNSETARAYSEGTVLLPIDRALCAEVLKGDKEQAYLFLSLLTRMLGKRLLETVEKIFQWKLILSGRQVKGGNRFSAG